VCGLVPIVVITPICVACIVAPIFMCHFVAPVSIFVVGARVRSEALPSPGESASPISVFRVSAGVLRFGFRGRGRGFLVFGFAEEIVDYS
jgi:hypothetical protein